MLAYNLPNESGREVADLRCTFDVEDFMQAFSLRLLLHAGQDKIEDAVEEDDDQDQHVCTVASFVDGDNEAETLHDKSDDQKASNQCCKCGSTHTA